MTKISIAALTVLILVGCGRPTEQPMPSAATESKEQKVPLARLFAGTLTSKIIPGKVPVSAMVNPTPNGCEIEVVFFVGDMVVPIIGNSDHSVNEGQFEFELILNDPRGFKQTVVGQYKGNQIIGTYRQPNDSGEFVLRSARQINQQMVLQ